MSVSIEPDSGKGLQLGSGKVSGTNLQSLRKAMGAQHHSPTFSSYAEKNSLPYTSSLRALANKSVKGIGAARNSEGSFPAYNTDRLANITIQHRHNSLQLD